MAAVLVRVTLYPFEFLRSHLISRLSKASLCEEAARVLQQKGVLGFYSGISASLLGVALYRSVYFGLYDSSKGQFAREWEKWLVSYGATCAAILCVYPSDTIRQRMMVSQRRMRFKEAARRVLLEEGLPGLFRGASLIFLQGLVSGTIYWMIDRMLRQAQASSAGP